MTNFIEDLEWRYTTKAYDPSRKISDEDMQTLLKSLELAPTSINSQSTRYFIASSEQAISKVAEATKDKDKAYNTDKILKSSHSIVFASKVDYTDEDIKKLVELEQTNGRLPVGSSSELMERYQAIVKWKKETGDISSWLSKQAYIALGFLLSSAAILRIDSTVIGGIDLAMLNESLGLTDQGLSADFVVSLGYRSEDDNNAPAKTKKSRFSASERFFNI